MERELRLNINSDQIKKGLKTVGDGLKKLQKIGTGTAKAIGKAFKAMAKTISIGVAAAAVGLVALVKVTLDSIDKMGKLATQTGIAVETLGVFKFAADLAGTSLDAVTKAAVRLGTGISDFVTKNTGEAKDAFIAMGVSVEDLTPILNDSEAQLKLVADKFSEMEDGAQKTTLAYKLFGRAGVQLIPLLNEGAAGFARLREEAEKYGLLLSEKTVRGVEAANDAFTRLKARLSGFLQQTVGALAPSIQRGFEELGDAIDTYVKKHGGIKAVAVSVATAVLESIKSMVTAFGDFANSMASIINTALRAKAKWEGTSIVTREEIDRMEDLLRVEKEWNAAMFSVEKTTQGVFPGFDFEMSDELKQAVDDANDLQVKINKAKEGIILIGEGFDLSGFESSIDKAIAKVKELSLVEGGTGGGGGTIVDDEATAMAATQSLSNQKVEALTQSLMTEEERIAESFMRRTLIVQEAHMNDLIGEQTNIDLQLRLNEDFENAKTAIAQRGARDRTMINAALVGNTASMLGSISQLMTSNSKKQSRAAKVLAQASIIANTAAGIMKSHAQVPWPGNWAEAGAIALAGAASLRQLNLGGSISTGSAGVAPGDVASPPPVSTPTAVDDSRGDLTVILDGNFYGWDDQVIDELIVGIASAVDDRDVRLISPTSRNAQDLAEAAA